MALACVLTQDTDEVVRVVRGKVGGGENGVKGGGCVVKDCFGAAWFFFAAGGGGGGGGGRTAVVVGFDHSHLILGHAQSRPEEGVGAED